jgi:hypothetical protein
MTTEGFDLGSHLARQRAAATAFAGGHVAEALAVYLEEANRSIRKANLEWQLASAVLERGLGGRQVGGAWPAERLAHAAGASLRFVVAQVADEVLPSLPPGLAPLPALPGWARALLAEAWLRRPRCAALSAADKRRPFARWLATHPPVAGTALLAAGLRSDDPELVAELADRWLARGIVHRAAPAQLRQASSLPALADVARRALARCLGRFLEDDGALVKLLEAALALDQGDSALAISATLLRRPIEAERRRRVLALRLAALAALQRRGELADEYRRFWQPSGWVYPWPERLLYVFQQAGEDDLARHLLAAPPAEAAPPRWVVLSSELLAAKEVGAKHLEGWKEAYLESPQDERVLVGATRAVLRAPLPLKKAWTERLGLDRRWAQLASFADYRELAGGFLVLLCCDDEDRISEFERRLVGECLASLPAQWAARVYVQALRRRKQWDRLRKLAEADDGRFARACSFAEWELVRVLSQLEDLPGPGRRSERAWCEGWERSISQPLAPEEVAEVLDHFVNLRRSLERRGGLQHEQALLDDVTLQMLRRGKAAAESLLAQIDAPATEVGALRRRLVQAGPEASLRILQDLLVRDLTSPVEAAAS